MRPQSHSDAREQRTRFKRRLLTWFRRHGRDLPWRRTRDPYRVLVSEVMLQQTQVARVEEYFHRFLESFPTIQHLARAHPDRVRELWDGLGYYRRAVNLHKLAREVVTNHDGELPPDAETLRGLPGVGSYTAGAVASFAYELAEPAIDTNVSRVLRRVFHPDLPAGAAAERTLHQTAKSLVPRRGRNAWLTNQALMELGALVCTARVMKCEQCPVRGVCLTEKREARSEKRDASGIVIPGVAGEAREVEGRRLSPLASPFSITPLCTSLQPPSPSCRPLLRSRR